MNGTAMRRGLKSLIQASKPSVQIKRKLYGTHPPRGRRRGRKDRHAGSKTSDRPFIDVMIEPDDKKAAVVQRRAVRNRERDARRNTHLRAAHPSSADGAAPKSNSERPSAIRRSTATATAPRPERNDERRRRRRRRSRDGGARSRRARGVVAAEEKAFRTGADVVDGKRDKKEQHARGKSERERERAGECPGAMHCTGIRKHAHDRLTFIITESYGSTVKMDKMIALISIISYLKFPEKKPPFFSFSFIFFAKNKLFKIYSHKNNYLFCLQKSMKLFRYRGCVRFAKKE